MLSAWRIVPRRCAMTRHVLSDPSASRASWTEFSVTVSKALVASSSTTNGGSLSRHLAIAVLCFSPPDNLRPRSPTTVSQPSGKERMNSNIWADLATLSRSSSVPSRFPYKILCLSVSLNNEVL
mmetsp:Transcript_7772/g.8988  ORF Transcript_7772/g.8988 Transcript_7772/m.8988 type:complete len:124 (-) Transcript_7772:521-892(-)